METRDAKLSDYAEIAHVKHASWVAAYPDVIDNEYWEQIRDNPPEDFYPKDLYEIHLNTIDAPYIVCEHNSRIIGYCQAVVTPTREYFDQDTEAEILVLYVHPDYWNQGAGTLLINTIQQKLLNIDSSLSAMSLLCFEKNSMGHTFYQSRGFFNAGKTTQELQGVEYTMIVYTKSV